MAEGISDLTDATFDEEIGGANGPVLVDFWAEWCGPCKMIAPALEELSQTMGEQVTIAKLNIDENPETPGKYGVRGIPTMLLFKNGEAVAQKVAPQADLDPLLVLRGARKVQDRIEDAVARERA